MRCNIKNICLIVLAGIFLIGLVSSLSLGDRWTPGPLIKMYEEINYNFVDEIGIKAFQCRMADSSYIPVDLSECDDGLVQTNDDLIEITSDSGLDFIDENLISPYSYKFKSLYHYFVLDVHNASLLQRMKVDYVSFNANNQYTRTHSLYIRNFEEGEWELLDEQIVPTRSKAYFEGVLDWREISEDYVSDEGKMMFVASDGLSSFGAINSDFFKVELKRSLVNLEHRNATATFFPNRTIGNLTIPRSLGI